MLVPRLARAEGGEVLTRQEEQIPHDLCVDGGVVYWTDRGGGTVWRVPADGGSAEEIVRDLAAPRWIVAAGGAVYVSTDAGVVRIDEKTHATTTVLADPAVLAADRRAVFAASASAVVRIDLRDGSAHTLTDAVADPIAIAVDGDDVLVASEPAKTIVRVPRKGGPPVVLATLAGAPMVLAIDGATIYTQASGGDELLAVPRAGGAPRTAIAHTGEIDALIAARGTLFWSSIGDGTVHAASVRARRAHVVAYGESRPIALAAAGDVVYWLDATLGGGWMWIVRAPRPSAAALK